MSALVALSVATLLASSAPPETAGRIPTLRVDKFVLPNGLQVILHVDHATPIVGVNVWYHVGSKNERPGRTGFAHLFEHMMFQGSQHSDRDYFAPIQKVGGRLNGSTMEDRTNYWETVPANCLELALWMESDRMAYLLPAMTQKKLDNQRSVVKNERRQSYENRPYGLTEEIISAALYPPQHPYSWPVIGSMVDLDKASREDVADFFRRYYHPANASLCIAGDFDPAEARRLVEKYFAPIPAGPKIEKMAPIPVQLTAEKRLAMVDRVGLPRLYVTWPSTEMFSQDDAALTVLAQVLTGTKTARLHKILVRDRQIAQSVEAYQSGAEAAGQFLIEATARPGHNTHELEAVIFDELGRIQQAPPAADEVARAVTHIEVGMIRSLESISGFGGRADRLNRYNVFTGDPGYMAADFDRFLQVTPAAVQQAAVKYLGPGRVVLDVTPGDQQHVTDDPRVPAEQARDALAHAAPPETHSTPREPATDAAWQAFPQPAAAHKFALPAPQRLRLSNGMELVVIPRRELPLVSLALMLPGGRATDPADQPGLATITAAVWDEGTQHRTAEQLADELAALGASLSIDADWGSTNARLFTLKRQLPAALDLYADVLRHPTFPDAELGRIKNRVRGYFVQLRDEPTLLGQLALMQELYGPAHPYGYPQYGTPHGVAALTAAQLRENYARTVNPQQATLVAVGDVTAAELVPQLEERLADWKTAAAVAPRGLPPPLAAAARVVLVDKPGAAQSVISVGQVGAARNSPDFYALTVMNSIFGGQFSSRLNLNLREAKGYTYGAHSMYVWRPGLPGPFQALASVQTAVTAPALTEFFHELQGIAGGRAVTADELSFSKDWLTRAYAADFETASQMARQIEALVTYRLSDDYFNTYVPRIEAVAAADVARVTQAHLDIGRLTVVIVGDRSKIEAGLRKLPACAAMQVLRFDEEFRLKRD